METTKPKKFTQSFTFKGFTVGILVLLLLVPQNMILNLIDERKDRSQETVEAINNKWSDSQTLCGPVLSIPFLQMKTETETVETKENKKEKREKITYESHTLHITPEQLNIKTQLFPEEKHYGIYKTILYKSDIDISGTFGKLSDEDTAKYNFLWEKAYMTLGLSDLKGVSSRIDFTFGNLPLDVEAGGSYYNNEKQLIMAIPGLKGSFEKGTLTFQGKISLNGSSSIGFIPIGKNTQVEVAGDWKSPGFIGNFSPDSHIGESFTANWNILHFNRNIPEVWLDEYSYDSFHDSYFGVNLVNTVDHYQQNTRSAKYALMFIALTFVVFFFVEILTGRKIHPLQYLLVGIALILFYSLLLSISEQINFAVAYLIASAATIGLITAYTYSIFKNRTQTGILASLLGGLYIFLFVILQLEDVALLIGSIGLFVILGVIMFVSRKINFYKQEDTNPAKNKEIS
ncbi:MAG: cell envelope integrity protein CreD [Tannerella sp.]|jgi:inner membrane protein|nr:cell envelope integrity protein CreD [Tannerella sp.]